MVTIIDYGVGNIGSLKAALMRVGINATVSKDAKIIKDSKALILPGVGAFKDAIKALEETGLIPLIKQHVETSKPLLGICLGMQMLMLRSYEEGVYEGLNFIEGDVIKFKENKKIPHMGWNTLTMKQESDVLKYSVDGDDVYFVHSYFVDGANESCIATTKYDESVCAAIKKGLVIGTQFHPEKSGQVGLNILKAFKELIE